MCRGWGFEAPPGCVLRPGLVGAWLGAGLGAGLASPERGGKANKSTENYTEKSTQKSQITALWCAFKSNFVIIQKHPKYSKRCAPTAPRCALRAIVVFLAGGARAGRLLLSLGKIAISDGRTPFCMKLSVDVLAFPQRSGEESKSALTMNKTLKSFKTTDQSLRRSAEISKNMMINV